MPRPRQFDAIVVGTGQAGPARAASARNPTLQETLS
jgi:succinate dehydrogenase/fumarate reductase flavoprotein subunit